MNVIVSGIDVQSSLRTSSEPVCIGLWVEPLNNSDYSLLNCQCMKKKLETFFSFSFEFNSTEMWSAITQLASLILLRLHVRLCVYMYLAVE